MIICLKNFLYNILNNSNAKKSNIAFLFIIFKKSRIYQKNIIHIYHI